MPQIALLAPDGHHLTAYEAGNPKAPHALVPGLVIVQEIFGINHHIRTVADRYAEAGYHVIAPALFDRIRPGIELAYTPEDVARGRDLRAQVPDEATMNDIEAAAAALGAAPKAIVGFCWGGTIAWWGSTRSTSFKAAIGWYGGGIAATSTETPGCPVQLHFGETDAGIPLTDVETIRTNQPTVEIFTYPRAGHGFGCDERASFDPEAAALATQRTLTFLKNHL